MPKSIVLDETELAIAAAILTADIPAVDRLNRDPLEVIETVDYVNVDADRGLVEVVKNMNLISKGIWHNN